MGAGRTAGARLAHPVEGLAHNGGVQEEICIVQSHNRHQVQEEGLAAAFCVTELARHIMCMLTDSREQAQHSNYRVVTQQHPALPPGTDEENSPGLFQHHAYYWIMIRKEKLRTCFPTTYLLHSNE